MRWHEPEHGDDLQREGADPRAVAAARRLGGLAAQLSTHSRGFRLGELDVARTHIELAVPDGTAFKALVRAGIACGDSLGGPPAASSLQTFADRVVLYLPKQCLLDRDVAAV